VSLTSRRCDWENGGCAGDEFHLACVIIDETDQLRPYYRERPLVRMPRHWKAFDCCNSETTRLQAVQVGCHKPHSFWLWSQPARLHGLSVVPALLCSRASWRPVTTLVQRLHCRAGRRPGNNQSEGSCTHKSVSCCSG